MFNVDIMIYTEINKPLAQPADCVIQFPRTITSKNSDFVSYVQRYRLPSSLFHRYRNNAVDQTNGCACACFTIEPLCVRVVSRAQRDYLDVIVHFPYARRRADVFTK